MMQLISIIAFVGSIIVLALNTVGNIIYAIYLWGGTGLPFATSLWMGVQSWLLIGVSAIVVAILSAIVLAIMDDK